MRPRSSKARWLLGAALVAAVGAAYLLRRGDSSGGPPSRMERGDPGRAAGERALDAAPSLEGRPDVPAAPAEDEKRGVGLSLLARHAGGGHARQFSLVVSRGTFRKRVSTKGGVIWDAVPEPGRYDVTEIEVDGKRYVADPPHVNVGTDQVTLTIEAAERMQVSVRAADTHEPVPFPRAVREQRFGQPSAVLVQAQPGLDVKRGDAEGLLDLPVLEEDSDWFVVADGFAWGRLDVRREAGPATVLLERGGTLHLHVNGWNAVTEPVLNCWSSSRLDLPAPGPDGTLVAEGIPVGRYSLQVQRASSLTPVYGETTFTIAAGQRTPVELQVSDPDAASLRPLRGDLIVPEGWQEKPMFLGVEGADWDKQGLEVFAKLVPDEHRPGRFTFESKPLPPGTFLVQVHGIEWYRCIVFSADSPPVELRPPSPVRTLVRVEDASEGVALLQAAVRYLWQPDSGAGCGEAEVRPGSRRVEHVPGAGGHVVVTAPGQVWVSASAPGFLPKGVEVTAGSDRDPVVLRLERAARLTVRVLEGGKPSPADLTIWVSTSSGALGRETRAGEAAWDELEPGERHISVKIRTPGYAPPKPQSVRLTAGETSILTFDLSRAPPR